jgi:hypothetical protein
VVVIADYEVEVIQELEQGPPGPPGPAGAPSTIPGPKGDQGIPGNTVLYGTIDPVNSVGIDGNFYINTTSHFMFGPKANGIWPAGTSLIGPRGSQFYTGAGAPGTIVGQANGDNYLNTTNGDVYTLTAGAWGAPVGNIRGPQGIQGIQGPQGIQGIQGIPGNTVLYGAADPVAGTGVDGNFYINTTSHFLFGPKAAGAWPAGASLIGPPGPQGIQGPGGTDAAAVHFDAPQSLTLAQTAQARSNIFAAPMDLMAYSGLQINGAMDINQWNPGSVGIQGYYIVDQWLLFKTGAGTWAAIQSNAAPPSGYYYNLKMTVSVAEAAIAAGDQCGFQHVLEGWRIVRLGWSAGANPMPLTMCFLAKAHRPGIYGGAIRGGSPMVSYPFSYNINAADTWEWKVINVPPPPALTFAAGAVVSAYITFMMAAGATFISAAGAWATGNFLAPTNQINGIAATTDTFEIAGLIILPGNEAPSQSRAALIQRSFQDELRTCMRYYENGYVNWSTISGAQLTRSFVCTIPFKVQKRAAPTMSMTNTAQNRVNNWSPYAPTIDKTSFVWNNTDNTGDDMSWSCTWIADSRLA